ncbi:hypothetical protein GpartN1_g2714.t1 [Galdieria partita]|uniref:CHCH domain-containing protein n=1 Tax=Galdieria partita TaxID=83374 RepID=A0A9C7PU91_9RHOD|nr:hypothetical protein GpartN1_g2714.t1 [Galdieria partita]
MGRRGGSGGAAPRRTPLRSKTPLFAKREQEKDTSNVRQSSRSASSLAKPPLKNNNTQRDKANNTGSATAPSPKPSLTSSLFGGMLGSMLPMFLFMNWFRKSPDEKEPNGVEDEAQKKCQKFACNIQDCLEKNDYQQSMCEEAIRKYHACMEAAKGNYENL